MQPRQDKEIDFSSVGESTGLDSNSKGESGDGLKITVDNEELINVAVKSAIGGIASAWAVKSALGDN